MTALTEEVYLGLLTTPASTPEDVAQALCAQARAEGRACTHVLNGIQLVAYPSTRPEEVRQAFQAYQQLYQFVQDTPNN